MCPTRIILASQSPRRQQFFLELGIRFQAESADIDEAPEPKETPQALVERLAVAKALTVGRRLAAAPLPEDHPDHAIPILVIGADTVVAVDGDILGKPAGASEACAMLRRLRARAHHVHTALAAAYFVASELHRIKSLTNTSTVHMRPYNDSEIAAYIATGDPMDKAGAYAIQHLQFRPARSLSGCSAGVMGLPLADLLHLLADFDIPIARAPQHICPAMTGLQCCQPHPPSSQ